MSHGLRACWSTPIFNAQRRVLGTFAIYYRQPGPPAPEHRRWVDMATHLAAIAISRHQTEAALRESEERFCNAFHASPAGITVTRLADGRFVDVNQTFLNLFEFSRDEVIGHTSTELKMISAEERSQWVQGKLESRALGSGELVARSKSGRSIHLLYSSARMELAGEAHDVATLIDVTARKQVEAELRRSEEVLQLFVEHSPAAIAMFDREMKYIVASRRFLADYDLGEQKVVGRSHYDVFPEIPDRWKEIHRRCLAGAIERAEEDQFPRADGRVDWVRWELRPWHEADGGIGGLILFSEVITERKRAEAAVHESEARLRNLFDQANDGIYLISAENRYLDANERGLELLGYTRDELLRMGVADVLAPHEVARLAVEPPQMMSGVRHLTEWEHVRKDGTTFPGEVSARRLDDHSYLAIVRDLTERRRAEAALRLSEERFNHAFHAGPAGLTITRIADGKIVEANESFARMFGFSREEVIGHTSAELGMLTPAARAEIIKRQLETGGVRDTELRARAKSGRILDLLVSSQVMAIDGEPHHVTTIIDVTKRKEAEAALRASEESYRMLFREMMSAFARCEIIRDPQGRAIDSRYLEVNPAYERATGMKADDLVGKRLFEVFPGLEPDWIEILGRVALTGQPKHVEKAVAPLGIWVELMAFCPGPNQYACTFTDITDRKRAEESLRESEARLRLSVSASNIGLWDWNLATNDVYFSREWKSQLGYSEDELPNHFEEWRSRLHPDDVGPTLAKVRRFIENPAADYAVEFRLRHKDGSYRWIFTQAQIFRDVGGKPARMMGCHIDITERKLAEEAARQSREQLRALLARLQQAQENERIHISREIHDELGQLLTGLKMDVRWLERKLSEPGLPPALNPLLDRAVAASSLADATIATVQKIAAELRPGALDRLGLAAALQQEARRFQERSGIVCTVRLSEPAPVLAPAAATELFYICREALTNVARHAHSTQVEISLQVEADAIVLEVRDDGIGLPDLAPAASDSLGLLGMRERAIVCGGEVHFDRADPHGACVRVRIPR